MPLLDLSIPVESVALPGDVLSLLQESNRRIEQFQRASRVPGFVPSDFVGAYRILRAIAESGLPARGFCEWGSGFGVVACLAAMLEFDSYGIEIDEELVEAARRLAEDFGLPVEFEQGSFIPTSSADKLDAVGEFSWLVTQPPRNHNDVLFTPEEFDLIFAYPWPDDERVTADLFEEHAAGNAILLTYHGGDEFRIRQKIRRRRRTSRLRRS
jgi:predicted O-methyltransferase YrrM